MNPRNVIPRYTERRTSRGRVMARKGAFAALCAALAGCSSSSGGTGGGAGGPSLEWAQWPMPDSGAIFCTDGSTQISCPSPGQTGYGQDGNYDINPPSYTAASDTVLDEVTGLRWQRVVPSAPCNGNATCTWAEAKAYCEGLTLEGYTGWRLPTYIEIISIVDLGRYDPAVDTAAFPATPSEFFWSSSLMVNAPGSAWGVNFQEGHAGTAGTEMYSRARCVR